MNEHRPTQILRLFELVIVADEHERAEILDRECAGDRGLKRCVANMIAALEADGEPTPTNSAVENRAAPNHGAHGADPEAMAAAAPRSLAGKLEADTRSFEAPPTTSLLSAGETAGQEIGRYKLLEEIGAGGFGTVWMAQQRKPVKRRVALKVIKLGMDTRQVIARFEAERQALAMMDHPHIAKVFDAGCTDAGRPYFVMEYIKGISIVEYCNTAKLETKARLDLFVSVCQAIQHAHQKGIIHRDIKPSNVLVTLHDGKPVPKVIDFGIAKATNTELTQKTLFTEHRQMIGTPAYMSPEQAEMSGLDIDTRADIYSLGVLLYELLTGTTPFDPQELMSKGYAEMMRIIREQEPQKPSTRLSSLGTSATLGPDSRQLDTKKLGLLLRGDLDWIVMKCLAKDRTRRYETANGLAADIGRHLANEPVSAGPPSAAYKLRKFVKRNRGQVIAGGVLAATLILGVVGTTSGMLWALAKQKEAVDARQAESAARQQALAHAARADLEAERAKAAAAEKAALAEEMTALANRNQTVVDTFVAAFRSADPDNEGVTTHMTALEVLQQALAEIETNEAMAEDELTKATLLDAIGHSFHSLGRNNEAIQARDSALTLRKAKLGDEHPETLTSMNQLAASYLSAGRRNEAIPLFEETLRLRKAKLGDEHPDTLASMNNLALGYDSAGRLNEAISLWEETLRLTKAKLGNEHPSTLNCLSNLAAGYYSVGRLDELIPLLEETLRRQKAKLGNEHPSTLNSMNNLAFGYNSAGRLDEAIPLWEETLRLTKAKLGNEHPDTLNLMSNLAAGYRSAGRLDEAIPLLEETLRRQTAKLGDEHPDTLSSMNNLAASYYVAGRLDEAIPLLEETLRLRKANLGDEHPDTLTSMGGLAASYYSAGRLDEAIPLLEEALRRQTAKLGDEHPQTLNSMNNLAEGYRSAGRLDEAIPLLEETLRRQTAKLGDEHPDTLSSMNNLAASYYVAGRLDEAIPLLEETLRLRQAKLGDEHPDTLTSMGGLAASYYVAGRLDEAIPLLEETLRRQTAKLGDEHFQTLNSMNILAAGYRSAGRLDEAIPLYEETLRLRKAKLGDKHPDTMSTLRRLQAALLQAGKFEEAKRHIEDWIRITEQSATSDLPELARARTSLAEALWGMQRVADAEAQLDIALASDELNELQRSRANSIRGAILASRANWEEAEPLLVESAASLAVQLAEMKDYFRWYVPRAHERVIAMYEARDQLEQIAQWQSKLGEVNAEIERLRRVKAPRSSNDAKDSATKKPVETETDERSPPHARDEH